MDKLESFKDIKYHEDILYVLGLIQEQKKRKPTDTINKMSKCMTDIAFYVNHLQLTRENYGAIVREMHTKILKLQDENRELKEELKGYTEEVDFDLHTEQETKEK
jgi:predicted RNase H-like nuclease (RuvC/YqgF family)